jgi:type III pantothenate kinase
VKALLIDIGNSRVKWALFSNGRVGRPQAAPYQKWRGNDFHRAVFGGVEPDRIIVASVAGPRTNEQIRRAAKAAFDLQPRFVRSERWLGGVTTQYKKPWRLGVDRLVAVIGAHHLVPDRPVCVVDVGTAMTLDLVDARGVHRGGAIVPGPQLMVESLLNDTSGIRRRAAGSSRGRRLFAQDTRAAVEQGARYAVAAIIDRAVAEARGTLDATPAVLLSGGAAPDIRPLLRARHRHIPDLVLRGLAQLI